MLIFTMNQNYVLNHIFFDFFQTRESVEKKKRSLFEPESDSEKNTPIKLTRKERKTSKKEKVEKSKATSIEVLKNLIIHLTL